LLVILSGSLEPLFDQAQVGFRESDALLGFFLKGVEYVYDSGEANGVDGAIGVTIEIVHDLQHASAIKPLERFGVWCLTAQLRIPQRAANAPAYIFGKASQVLLAAPDPAYWLGVDVVSSRHRCPLIPYLMPVQV